ncbi:hypothetical protein BGX27_009872 [Mortierella sp. AM989]|nr:hypothetical protein BGX27_009872 [Mortierella sp. AM989]
MERNLAVAGLFHKQTAIAATTEVEKWLEIPAVPRKRKNTTVDWAKFENKTKNSHSTPYINAFRLYNEKKLPRQALKIIKGFKLHGTNKPDMIWALNTFKQATSWKTMKLLENEFHTEMEIWDALRPAPRGQAFSTRDVCKSSQPVAAQFSQKGSKNNEGWLFWNLHGPLMDVFQAIPHVRLRATDLKGHNNNNGDKHDILVTHEAHPLDIVIMEAKHHQQGSPMMEDIEKVARSMAENITRALELIPENMRGQYRHILRSFAVINSGLAVILLEARFIDNIPVIYKVRQFEVPNGPLICSQYITGLSYMLAFKDRVKRFLEALAELLSNASPPSTPPSNGDDSDDNDRESEPEL